MKLKKENEQLLSKLKDLDYQIAIMRVVKKIAIELNYSESVTKIKALPRIVGGR